MRAALRLLTTLTGTIFGAGVISPIVSANWQEWAKATGQDQYLVRYAAPLVDKLAAITGSGWFIFVTGFFIGGAAFLWMDYFLRTKPEVPNEPILPSGNLAHALHMPSNSGMSVIVDKRKKVVQIGFHLKNSSEIALRYSVSDISVIIEGQTVMNPAFSNRGAIVQRGDITTFRFPPIPFTIGKKDIQAEASIVYNYGPAEPDVSPVREANYRVGLTISPTAHNYVILEENDGKV